MVGVISTRGSGDFARCYACYGSPAFAKHRKPQDGKANVTDVTDVTSNRKGCTYRASAGARALAGYVNTPFLRGVTSVTSVTFPPQSCGFRVPVCRNIAVHVTPTAGSGVIR